MSWAELLQAHVPNWRIQRSNIASMFSMHMVCDDRVVTTVPGAVVVAHDGACHSHDFADGRKIEAVCAHGRFVATCTSVDGRIFLDLFSADPLRAIASTSIAERPRADGAMTGLPVGGTRALHMWTDESGAAAVVAVATNDPSVVVWRPGGQSCARIPIHGSGISSLSLLNRGGWVAVVGHRPGSCVIWPTRDVPSTPVLALASSEDTVLVAAAASTVVTYGAGQVRVATGAGLPYVALIDGVGHMARLALTIDGKMLAVARFDRPEVLLWDVPSATLISKIGGRFPLAVSFSAHATDSPDLRLAVATERPMAVDVFRVDRDSIARHAPPAEGYPSVWRSTALSASAVSGPDWRSYVATVHSNGCVVLWSGTGNYISTVFCHPDAGERMSANMHVDRQRGVASVVVTTPLSLRVIPVESGPASPPAEHEWLQGTNIYRSACAPVDRIWVAVVLLTGNVQIIDVADDRCVRTIDRPAVPSAFEMCVQFSPRVDSSGRCTLAIVTGGGSVSGWSLLLEPHGVDAVPAFRIDAIDVGSRHWFRSMVAFPGAPYRFAVCDWSRILLVKGTARSDDDMTIELPTSRNASCVCMSHDGTLVAVGCTDGHMMVYEVGQDATAVLKHDEPMHSTWVTDICIITGVPHAVTTTSLDGSVASCRFF